jgi:hypothetical protein
MGGKFRTMQDEIPHATQIDLTGLRDIQASGGDMPRFLALHWWLRGVKLHTIIVNAEPKSIGYINALPASLFKYGNKKLGWRRYIRRLLITGTLSDRSDRVSSEAEEAKKYGFDYEPVIIGSRFTASDQDIDKIIIFLDNLPKNTWLHFHCKHGAGRTSMLLVMLDMMKNAPKVALHDIVQRQHLLGSVDLFDTNFWGGVYTKDMLENRKKFIEQFYEFICQRKAGGTQLWSEWQKQKP